MKTACAQKKQITFYGIGKSHIETCGKDAVVCDQHGRPLCLHHFNRWEKKRSKYKPQPFKH